MTGKSRAAVLIGREKLEIQDFGLPVIGPDDGLLRVEAAGICGSDWAQYLGTLTAMPEIYPVIPGHEIVGRIHEVGESAASRWGVSVGDLVAVGMSIPGRGVYGLSFSTDSAGEFSELSPAKAASALVSGSETSSGVAAAFSSTAT